MRRVRTIVRSALAREARKARTQVEKEIKTPKGTLLHKKGMRDVRSSIYRKGILGLRVYVSNRAKTAMTATGRRTQPLLPLTFWYEQGFGIRTRKCHTMARGLVDIPTSKKTTPGIHALDRANTYLAGSDDRVFREVEDRINKEFENI